MVRFFPLKYSQLLVGRHVEKAATLGSNDRRNLVADVQFENHVLHVVIHRPLAQAEDPGNLIGRLAERR